MTLEEMQARLKKEKITTEDDMWAITPIYCLLDFHKDDFCKLIDAIGLDKWLDKSERWERLSRAENELRAKERYLSAKNRLADLAYEKEQLESIVSGYERVTSCQH